MNLYFILVECLFEKKNYMTKCGLFRLYLCKGVFGTIYSNILEKSQTTITRIGKWWSKIYMFQNTTNVKNMHLSLFQSIRSLG